MAFSTYKTSSHSFWAYIGLAPSWLLDFTGNAWDTVMDKLDANFATFTPYVPANTTAPLTVTSSPYTYTAGSTAEFLFIEDILGSISSITKHGQAIGSQTMVWLAAGQSVTFTYAGPAPTIVRDR